jgi:hypothetical protein
MTDRIPPARVWRTLILTVALVAIIAVANSIARGM